MIAEIRSLFLLLLLVYFLLEEVVWQLNLL